MQAAMQRAADWWLDTQEGKQAPEQLWSDDAVPALLETLNQVQCKVMCLKVSAAIQITRPSYLCAS